MCSSDLDNLWQFSVTNAELGKQLESMTGKKVRLSYHQYLISPISISTDYVVDRIEEVKD